MNQLEIFLNEVLRPNSFKKRGNKWYYNPNDKICKVIQISRDRYTHLNPGEIGIVTFGICLTGLQPYLKMPPDARHCAFSGEHWMLIDGGNALKYKSAISTEKGTKFWIEDFKQDFVNIALPRFQQISSISYLKQNFPNNWDMGIMNTAGFWNHDIVDYLNTIENV